MSDGLYTHTTKENELTIIASGGTDIGRKRRHNEDSFGVYDELGLYLVADGMGGHAAGEVASQAAVKILRDFMDATVVPDEITWPFERDGNLSMTANRLVVGIRLANRVILDRAKIKPELKGMGTTIVAAVLEGDRLHIAHVGDSRAYRFSGGTLARVTVDHSFVEEQVSAGIMSAEQARTHPLRNVITRALGVRDDMKVDINGFDLVPGDMYLFCSDGLSGMLGEPEITQTLMEHTSDLDACIQELIRRANEKGGDDNITAVLLRVA